MRTRRVALRFAREAVSGPDRFRISEARCVGRAPHEEMMRLSASDIVSLYRPTPCALRVYLRQKGITECLCRSYGSHIEGLGLLDPQVRQDLVRLLRWGRCTVPT